MTSVGTPASTRSLISGIRVNFDLTATKSLLWLRGGALWGDRMPQSGGYLGKRTTPRRFFYALFTGAYFTYTGFLALAKGLAPILRSSHLLSLKFLSLGAYGRGILNLWRRKQ